MKKIAVIGSMSTDFVVGSDIRPGQGETVLGNSFNTFFGGKGANQAVAAARSGLDVWMIGAVGEDNFGEEIIANLAKDNINVSGIAKVAGIESGSAHITIADSDNSIIVVPAANSKLKVEDIQQHSEKLKEMDLIILQNEISVDVILYVIDWAKEQGVNVLYNPAPAIDIPKDTLTKVTYATPNEHEYTLIYGDTPMEEQLAKQPNQLLITLGSEGVMYHDGDKIVKVPAQLVTNVVDTTGAGDTFNGYFAKGILSDLGIKDSVKLGNIASSIAIQKDGAQDGIPLLTELKEHEAYEEKWNLK